MVIMLELGLQDNWVKRGENALKKGLSVTKMSEREKKEDLWNSAKFCVYLPT